MKVRDKTQPVSDYKGRYTDACESVCPCRPCYNAHDCSDPVRVYKYGVWVSNKIVPKMECATRYNRGCPEKQSVEPSHIYKSDRSKRCIRCGHYRTLPTRKAPAARTTEANEAE